jgi:hypothetical protein
MVLTVKSPLVLWRDTRSTVDVGMSTVTVFAAVPSIGFRVCVAQPMLLLSGCIACHLA